MKIIDCQELARKTAVYPKNYSVVYPALGLTGETTELSDTKRGKGGFGSTGM